MGLNCKISHHLFASHWIRIAAIVRYLVLQSTPTRVMAGPGNSAITPFFESVFLNVLSYYEFMIQQTISQQCFLCWAKKELFVHPAMFPPLPEHLASRYLTITTIFREIEQDNSFIIQQIDNKTRNIFKSCCGHFFTSLFLSTYEATYIAGYLLSTDDRYREHHDHICVTICWIISHIIWMCYHGTWF